MFTRLFLLFLAFTLFSTSIFAQKNEKIADAQIGVAKAELVDLLMVTMPGWGEKTRGSLRQRSIKTYMMPPREIGESGSSVSYILASCLEFYINFDKNYKINLSPDYIALSMAEEKPTDALNFLVKNGTVSADIVPYESRSIPTAVRATQKFTIKNYLYIFRKEEKTRQKVFAARKALMRGNPIVVEMRISKDFSSAPGELYVADKAVTDMQSLLVVAYDETRRAFELLSAWGNDWGENGYVWVSYEDFGRLTESAFVVVPEEEY